MEDKINERERSVDSIYYLCGSGDKTCVSIRLEIAAGLRHTCLRHTCRAGNEPSRAEV